MLLNFFRSERPIIALILFIISLIIWLINYFFGGGVPFSVSTSFAEKIFFWINTTPVLLLVAPLLIHLITAIILNTITNRFNFTSKRTFLVGFSYLLIIVASKECYLVSSDAVRNLLLALFLFRIFELPSTSKPKSVIFDTSFLVGLMTLLSFSNIFLMLLIWIGLPIFRSARVQEWLTSLVGIGVPFIYFFTVIYFFDSLEATETLKIRFSFPSFSADISLILLGITLLFVPALLNLFTRFGNHISVTRKGLTLVLMLTVILFITGIFMRTTQLSVLHIAIPISIIVGMFFAEIKKVIIAETLLFFFILIAIYFNFFLSKVL